MVSVVRVRYWVPLRDGSWVISGHLLSPCVPRSKGERQCDFGHVRTTAMGQRLMSHSHIFLRLVSMFLCLLSVIGGKIVVPLCCIFENVSVSVRTGAVGSVMMLTCTGATRCRAALSPMHKGGVYLMAYEAIVICEIAIPLFCMFW
jgi:hypothetical protein